MAGRKKTRAFAIPESNDVPQDLVGPPLEFSPDKLSQIDTDKVKVLFELQENQRNREYERQLFLQKQQLELNEQMMESAKQERAIAEKERSDAEKQKRIEHQFEIQKLGIYFKMFVSTAALTLGTIFVLTGHEPLGTFLLGGALSTVTSGALTLLRASRQHG